jgi:hypothetical protein
MILKSYRITVRGRLSERFEAAFEGMTLQQVPGRTVLTGHLMDQSNLFGILDRLRDFGLELLSVEDLTT